ncbi:MAG: type II secretion system protein [Opitutales bacterium]
MRRKPHPDTRRRGFTLLEVLVALAIFAVSAVVISEAFFNTLRALDQREQDVAGLDDLRFVRSQILLEPDLDTFEDGGDIETLDGGTARWEAEVEPTRVPHLFAVFLNIEFAGGETVERWTHRETLRVLRPTWSELGEAEDLLLDLQDEITDGRDRLDW